MKKLGNIPQKNEKIVNYKKQQKIEINLTTNKNK